MTEPFQPVPFLTTVVNAAGLDAEWGDEWLAWYKPDQWFAEHRALAVFIGNKIRESAAPVGGEGS